MNDAERCSVPPCGWWCSREPGHEGPCAARVIAERPKPACHVCKDKRTLFNDVLQQDAPCPFCATPCGLARRHDAPAPPVQP